MAMQSEKITAGYERLSRDDLLAGESMSIQNQKAIIEEYAARHGFTNIRHFADDGTSGTVFNRPGLNAMLEAVKAGNVATVIIKDQSRIGRDVLEDHVAQKLSDERFEKMLSDFETEQTELVNSSAALRAEVEEMQSKTANAQNFIKLAEQFSEITEMNAKLARTFIRKIVVHEADMVDNPKRKGHKTRKQEVHIFLNGIDEFELD